VGQPPHSSDPPQPSPILPQYRPVAVWQVMATQASWLPGGPSAREGPTMLVSGSAAGPSLAASGSV
jgi:hypothetical protein